MTSVMGALVDPRIVPGTLVNLSQRIQFIPILIRNEPAFSLASQIIPVWRKGSDGRIGPYEHVPSNTLAVVINRYVKDDVTKLEVLVGGMTYHCYGVHADLV